MSDETRRALSGGQYVSVEREGRIAIVTLQAADGNHSGHLHPIHHQVRVTVDALNRNSSEWDAIVITGVHDTFYRGPALENFAGALAADHSVAATVIADTRAIVMGLLELTTPVVAAVNGAAVGLGSQLALFSDVCVAAPEAYFQDTHVRVGLPAGDGGTLMWPAALGLSRAKRFLLTGARLDAQTAERWGLVHSIVPADEVVAHALTIARHWSGPASGAIKATKSALQGWLRLAVPHVFDPALKAEEEALNNASTVAYMESTAKRSAKREPEE
jgi:enoyl-CoA hydratase